MVITVVINESILMTYLLYNDPVPYTKNINLYPVRMSEILPFMQNIQAFTVRKNSIFPLKEILKMTYLDFLFYTYKNTELAIEFKMPELPVLLEYTLDLLCLVCNTQEVTIDTVNKLVVINGEVVSGSMFDDIRRIVIIQNDVDFDIDEFIHYDTELELEKAKNKVNKDEKFSLEDYIDSYKVMMKETDQEIKNITIRKFFRYIKRICAHEDYTTAKSGEMSGMISFKTPLKHWMSTLEKSDKYDDVKTSEHSLRNKVG